MLEGNTVSLLHYGIKQSKKYMPIGYFLQSFLLFLTCIFVFFGCAAKQPIVKHPVQINLPETSSQIQKNQNVEAEESQQENEKKFVVFFKSDFQGVLKTRYVKLTIIPMIDSTHEINVHLGDMEHEFLLKSDQNILKPEYVYLELPAGEYQISTVSILVGTTLASEKLNLIFKVNPEVINYLGTLVLNGTKEKIKLGGVPVIKPGFDFQIEILDESSDALNDLRQKYPDLKIPVHVGLFRTDKNDKS